MKKARIPLIILLLFVGVGAVFGAYCMFDDPTGAKWYMDGLLPGLQKLPFADLLFQNLVFSGISLLVVNGLCQLTAAVLMLTNHRLGVRGGLCCGVLLMAWITIQFFIFPLNFLSVTYFVFGALELLCGLLCLSAERKEAAAK